MNKKSLKNPGNPAASCGYGLLLAALGAFAPVQADQSSATVAKGDFATFAAGIERNFTITGHVRLKRVPAGKTIVVLHAKGLQPNTTYGAHVHNATCDDNQGGGHYQNEVGGSADIVNEIWPGFTTNADGNGSGYAANDFIARPEAQSVVIHDTDGARIACTDLN